MHVDRIELGNQAEERAAELVRDRGFEILARNFRCRSGELDIVARRDLLLVVAEVRLRSDNRFGGAAASITAAKRNRIVRATRYFLARHPDLRNANVRFDALLLQGPNGPVDWIEGAF